VTRIVVETFIEAPPQLCFDLARNAEIHAESAAFSGERLVPPGKLTGTFELGDLIAFEGRHFGLRQRFVAQITSVRPPHEFTDQMVKGIFHSLRHVHEFHPADGGTLMRDVLEWSAPLGLITDPLFFRRHMTWFVTTKQNNLKRIIEKIHTR
jgi:ligand-binding SRPBCC domain-containing protein